MRCLFLCVCYYSGNTKNYPEFLGYLGFLQGLSTDSIRILFPFCANSENFLTSLRVLCFCIGFPYPVSCNINCCEDVQLHDPFICLFLFCTTNLVTNLNYTLHAMIFCTSKMCCELQVNPPSPLDLCIPPPTVGQSMGHVELIQDG